MIGILTGPLANRFILQLYTISTVGRLLGNICYELEGDGPLIFNTYELYIRAVQLLRADGRLPEPVMDKIRQFSTVNGVLDEAAYHANELICREVISPARAYLAGQAAKEVVMKSVHVAKVAAMWNPAKVYGMSLNAAMLNELMRRDSLNRRIVPWITEDDRRLLAAEAGEYKAACALLDDPDLDILEFWKRNDHGKTKFPTWVKCARKFVIAQPSSAAIERVWSLFSNYFHDEDVKSLLDYINTVLLCKYNYRSSSDDSSCKKEDDDKRQRRRITVGIPQ
jgi:hypothetical protein